MTTPVSRPESDKASLSAIVKSEGKRLGFDLVGIAPAVTPDGFGRLQEWLRQGFAGEMEYIPRREAAYEHPRHVLDRVRSVVMLATNYRTAEPAQHSPMQGRVSRYAWGSRDYHDVLRERLQRLADVLHTHRPGCRTRGVVDTAPVLERDFARLAGLGWFGKNTMLINTRLGSWLFLAGLLTDVELEYDAPHQTSHCGTCTRCLDACPTDAFPEPYVLDSRRCISYLTIELHDRPIPEYLAPNVGRWVFGCDVCQDVCPWNRKAPISQTPEFQPVPELSPADLLSLLKLTETEFRERFRHTALSRPGRSGLRRNAAIALGNSRDPQAVPALVAALADPDPLVRGAAAWALGQIGGDSVRNALQSRLTIEDNPAVISELESALSC